MIQQAQAGEIGLDYVDKAGFPPQPPNRSVWSKVGKTHAVVSKRSQRLNAIGALPSSGRLLMAKLWHSVTGLWLFGFLIALIEEGQEADGGDPGQCVDPHAESAGTGSKSCGGR